MELGGAGWSLESAIPNSTPKVIPSGTLIDTVCATLSVTVFSREYFHHHTGDTASHCTSHTSWVLPSAVVSQTHHPRTLQLIASHYIKYCLFVFFYLVSLGKRI